MLLLLQLQVRRQQQDSVVCWDDAGKKGRQGCLSPDLAGQVPSAARCRGPGCGQRPAAEVQRTVRLATAYPHARDEKEQLVFYVLLDRPQ